MGFAAELIFSYHRLFPEQFSFRVFTDRRELVQDFFSENQHLLGKYTISDYQDFVPEETSTLIFSLFHFPIPEFPDEKKRLILRFDHVSLNPLWAQYHGNEHILSNNCTKIIEIIPSIFPKTGGVLRHEFSSISREEWLRRNHLSIDLEKKHWIFLFIYGSTIDRIDWNTFKHDSVFIFSDGAPDEENIIKLPFLRIDSFYELMMLSDIVCIRGEVSYVQALQSWKPFLWDMYKERGWFYEEQSEQFLHLLDANAHYRRFHNILNSREQWTICRDDLIEMSKNFPDISGRIARSGNLAQETKKYIDWFSASILGGVGEEWVM